jgi:hypothetical protein
MTTIRGTCPRGHDVELTEQQIRLTIRGDGTGVYTFPCVTCQAFGEKEADSATVALLVSGGVPAERIPVQRQAFTAGDLRDWRDFLYLDWDGLLRHSGIAEEK